MNDCNRDRSYLFMEGGEWAVTHSLSPGKLRVQGCRWTTAFLAQPQGLQDGNSDRYFVQYQERSVRSEE